MKKVHVSLLAASLTLLPVEVFGQVIAPRQITTVRQVTIPKGAGKLTGRPKMPPRLLAKGPVKLTAAQMGHWSKIILPTEAPRETGLWILNTGWTPSIIDTLAAAAVVSPPASPVTIGGNTFFPGLTFVGTSPQNVYYGSEAPVDFLLRTDGLGAANTKYLIQYSTSNHSSSPTFPYAGWAKPEGLIYSKTMTATARSTSRDSASGSFDRFISDPYAGQQVKLSPNANWIYLSSALPTNVTPQPGGTYYVRMVPLSGRDAKDTPIGPASNWQAINVKQSKDDQAKQTAFFQGLADKAAATKAAQDAAAAAQAKKNQEITDANAALANMKSSISNAYEVRVVSYIPPKFYDDENASNYFLANENVHMNWDGGSGDMVVGDTYDANQIKNLLDSNETWLQTLWDIATAELNLLSQIFTNAKNLVVTFAADGLSGLGIPCDADCHAGLMDALDFALAYCGIPPTLPNVDQLYSQGLDYLAETVASNVIEEATGVAVGDLGANPNDVSKAAAVAEPAAEAGVRKLADTIAHPVPFDPGVPETWGTPNPFFRAHPAMLYIEVRLRPGIAPPAHQTWQDLSVHFDDEFYSLPQIQMPRTIDHTIMIPIALKNKYAPTSWNFAGFMPVPNASDAGQPYYYSRGQEKIQISTRHRSSSLGGATFYVEWPSVSIDPGFVTAMPLPNDGMTPGQIRDALRNSNTLVQGPDHYTGKSVLKWFPPDN